LFYLSHPLDSFAAHLREVQIALERMIKSRLITCPIVLNEQLIADIAAPVSQHVVTDLKDAKSKVFDKFIEKSKKGRRFWCSTKTAYGSDIDILGDAWNPAAAAAARILGSPVDEVIAPEEMTVLAEDQAPRKIEFAWKVGDAYQHDGGGFGLGGAGAGGASLERGGKGGKGSFGRGKADNRSAKEKAEDRAAELKQQADEAKMQQQAVAEQSDDDEERQVQAALNKDSDDDADSTSDDDDTPPAAAEAEAKKKSGKEAKEEQAPAELIIPPAPSESAAAAAHKSPMLVQLDGALDATQELLGTEIEEFQMPAAAAPAPAPPAAPVVGEKRKEMEDAEQQGGPKRARTV
jgi:hypothetical protein